MSLFLFFKKQQSIIDDLLRIYKLIILYVFWVGLWLLFTRKIPSWNGPEIVEFIIRGGNSIFYYLFTLVFLTIIASLVRKWTIRGTWLLLFCFIVLINITFPILNMLDPRYMKLVAFWNPLLFLPTIFAAKLMVHYQKIIKTNKMVIFMIGIIYLLISTIEWGSFIHPNHKLILATEFPSYARASPLVGAIMLLSLSFYLKDRPSRPITLLSSVSLGLYCVHPFLLETLDFIRNLHGEPAFFFTISFLSILLTIGLKQILKERLI